MSLPLHDVERYVVEEGREILRLLLQQNLDARAPGVVGDAARIQGQDGQVVALSHRRPGERTQRSTLGELQVLRTIAFFFYGNGPRFVGGTGVTVLMTYADGTAAAISRAYGQGKVVAMGAHLECPSNLEDEKVEPPPGCEKYLLKLLDI